MSELCGKKFDRHTPGELRVGRLIHLSHTASSQVACDFVVCEFGSDHDSMKVGESLSDGCLGRTSASGSSRGAATECGPGREPGVLGTKRHERRRCGRFTGP